MAAESDARQLHWRPRSAGESGSTFFRPPTRSAVGAIENSLIAAGSGTILALVIGILAAYGIARFGAGGRSLPLRILQLRLFPPIVPVIPLFFVWAEVGLWGTLPGLAIICAGVTFPYVVWLIRGFLLDLPRETAVAAIVEGCTHWSASFGASRSVPSAGGT